MDLLTPAAATTGRKSLGGGTALIALAAMIALLYYGKLFFITLIAAIVLAFILEPVVTLFMRLKLPRPVASFITCTLALAVVYLAVLAFYSQAIGLWQELPTYSKRINELVDDIAARVERTEHSVQQLILPPRLREAVKTAEEPAPQKKAATPRRRSAEPPMPPAPPPVQEVRIREERQLFNELYGYFRPFYDVLLMASFVPFLVYFMLSWRDHMRRGFLQMFDGPQRMMAGKSLEGVANMARAYVVGNFFLGLLLSAATSVVCALFSLPFPLLVGPMSGFLSLIPYIGLPLALIPPFFAALPLYSKLGAYLIIGATLAFFHLLALNLLYPKLIGQRVHLNPLAVTIALMFWGTLWGGAGLVLGIPVTAGVKAVCDNVRDLEAYGKLLGD